MSEYIMKIIIRSKIFQHSVFFYLTGTVVTQTQAQYPDGSQTGISYSIFSGNKMQCFGINSITGKCRNGSIHYRTMFSKSTV